MDTLKKTIVGLLEIQEEFKQNKIVEIQFLSIIDIMDENNLQQLIIELKKQRTIQDVLKVLEMYKGKKVDNILIYRVSTQQRHSYIILIEDLEELYSFHKILAIIKM